MPAQPTRVAAETELIFYKQTAIPKRVAPGLVVADTLGDRMNLTSGDIESIGLEINPTITDAWYQQGAVFDGFYGVNGLNFIRFLSDGLVREGSSQNNRSDSSDDLSGWILQAREALLDSKIGTDPISSLMNVLLDTANTDIHWRPLLGSWTTIRPPNPPERTCIYNTGSDLTCSARTVGTIPMNRWIRFDVATLAGAVPNIQSALRVCIGNKYSVRLAHNQKAEVHEKIQGVWKVLRTLDNGPLISLHGGHYVIRFRRIAGRLVVGINEHTFHFIQTKREWGMNKNPVPIDDFWPEAPLQVNTYNCRARIGVGVIKNSTALGAPFSGTFGRHVRRRVPIVLAPGATLQGHCATWIKDGTSATVAITQVPGGLDYVVTMGANSDGLDTPFINKVMIRSESDWTPPGNDYLDCTAALRSDVGNAWNVSTAMPPLMPGADASFELSRTVLSAIDATWPLYIDKRCPVEFRVRWRLSNDTYEDAGTNDGWKGLFKGYVWQTNAVDSGMNQHTVTVNCKDSIIREMKPASCIDHKFPPLDILLFEAAANGTGGTTQTTPPRIYGSDAVKEILKIEHGPDFADTLNGNGNGQRFFPANHYALLDNETGGYYPITQALTGQLRAPTSNKFFFSPPWLQDALTWINQIAFDDSAIYFYGWTDGAADWPVPIYGKRETILAAIAGSTVIELPDVVDVDAGFTTFIQSATNETKPWLEYNRVLVYGRVPSGGMEAITPAVRMAERRLPSSDPNSAEKTWQSTLVIRESIADLYGAAETLATRILDDLRGVLMQWPTLTVDGDSRLQWGTIVRPIMETNGTNGNYSDTTIGLNRVEMRVEKVEHSGDGAGGWTTKIYPRPLTNSERSALGL